jgi:hypothetical protein
MTIRTFPGTIGETQPLKELPAAAVTDRSRATLAWFENVFQTMVRV